MKPIHKPLILGDVMIPSKLFAPAFERCLSEFVETAVVGEWEPDWDKLQYRRLEVEKKGPEIESVPQEVAEAADAEVLLGLFVPVSATVLESMPDLRVVGVCRAGLENVNLAEARNIARAHLSIKNGDWRKEFSNSSWIPELKEKTVGIVGLGHIGQLVARKLSGFQVKLS